MKHFINKGHSLPDAERTAILVFFLDELFDSISESFHSAKVRKIHRMVFIEISSQFIIRADILFNFSMFLICYTLYFLYICILIITLYSLIMFFN